MHARDLVAVYSLADANKAEVIKNALEAEGIRCFLDGAKTAGQMGIAAFEVRLLVPAEHADRARKLIESHEGRDTNSETNEE